jgi:hypothetical protein
LGGGGDRRQIHAGVLNVGFFAYSFSDVPEAPLELGLSTVTWEGKGCTDKVNGVGEGHA